MFSQSIVSRSGQLWKLLLAVAALLIGSFAPIYPETGIGWTLGTVIAIAGYAFGLFAIRCVDCSSMWFWEAAKDAGLYGSIFRGGSCPSCERSYAEK